MRRLHHDCPRVARHGARGTEKLPVAVGRHRRAIPQTGIGHRGFRGGGRRLRDRRTQNEQLQKQPAVLDP